MQNEHWFTNKLATLASRVSSEFPDASMDKVRALIDAFANEACLSLQQRADLLQRAGLGKDSRRCTTRSRQEARCVNQQKHAAEIR